MTQSHSNNPEKDELKRSLRTFTGQDWAMAVIAWLENPLCAPDDPVRQLLAFHPWDAAEVAKYLTAKEREWNLRWYREAVIGPDGPELNLRHASDLPLDIHSSLMLAGWNAAAQLWKGGLLDRIRVCARPDCGKLFFAKFSHTRYHADACRVASEIANPEYKKSRREYMRRQRNAAKRTGSKSKSKKGD